jgi:predicted alpha/beta-hydrolase family hydrolase
VYPCACTQTRTLYAIKEPLEKHVCLHNNAARGYPQQESLRDEPLCSLRLPLLFLRGTSDPFSTPEPWEQVHRRLVTADVEVRDALCST